jgi:serine protease Do
MRIFSFGLLLSSLLASGGCAWAEDFKLPDSKKWLAVASTKDLNTAIGIARSLGAGSQVVTSQSGYYAVVKGPYKAATIDQVKKLDQSIYDLPKDALLSNGARYLKSVWVAPSNATVMTGYEIDKPVHLSAGDVSVELKLEKVGEDAFSTVVSGSDKSGHSFSFTVGKDGEYVPIGAEAAFIKLDADAKEPQLVFTRYSGGAHCCTQTWVVTKPEGAAGWSLLEAKNLDGGGYNFEDVDGDGAQELLSVDNSFLYAFDSYAGSFAPVKISKLRLGKIEDVTDEPAMTSRLKQDLASMEYWAKVDPSMWKQNGYLAGWVANKIRLGQGEEGWQTVSENINRVSDFGPQECTTGQSVGDCSADNLKSIPVLKGLASFLKESGYGPLPDAAEAVLR